MAPLAFIYLALPTLPSFAKELKFDLNHSQEPATRQKMHISDNCQWAKNQPTAMALVGSEGAAVVPHIQSVLGVVVLEGLQAAADPKPLDIEFLGSYGNYPKSIRPGKTLQPSPRRPLAITIAALPAGKDSLVIRKGDYLVIKADYQLYTYALPEMTIPSEGLLRFYLGTDDTLYTDPALTHPAHSGICSGSRNKGGANGR
ncbi:MAG: hypothetical protein WC859_05920 [Elusimicrobiota bacterium]